MSSSNDYEHSKIFNDITNNEDGLMNLLAYALYKQEKVDWIAEFKSKNQRNPDWVDLEKYQSTVNTKRIDTLRDTATRNLEKFAEEFLDTELELHREISYLEVQKEESLRLLIELRDRMSSHEISQNSDLSRLKADLGAAISRLSNEGPNTKTWIVNILCSIFGTFLAAGGTTLLLYYEGALQFH
jgi:hypothetical protein